MFLLQTSSHFNLSTFHPCSTYKILHFIADAQKLKSATVIESTEEKTHHRSTKEQREFQVVFNKFSTNL